MKFIFHVFWFSRFFVCFERKSEYSYEYEFFSVISSKVCLVEEWLVLTEKDEYRNKERIDDDDNYFNAIFKNDCWIIVFS